MEELFIKNISLENFKGFEKKEIPFKDRFTVIIGNNGTGKTSILDGLAVAAACYLIPLGGGKKFQRPIAKEEVRVQETEKSVFERVLPCRVSAEGKYGHWERAIENLKYNNTVKGTKQITTISKGAIMAAVEGVRNDILPVFAYHGTGRLWAELNDHVDYKKQGGRTEGYENCFSAKSSSKAFRSWYKTLEKNIDKKDSQELKDRLKLFQDAISSCVDDWDGIYYDFGEDDIIGIKHTDNGDIHMPYRLMSDGYKTMIGLVADIAYRCIKLNPQLGAKAITETPGFVLIDELDLHLHPSWQRNIVKELMTCFPKIQFVATTHSPFIVQSLTKNQVYNLDGKELNAEPNKSSLETNALYMGVKSVMPEYFNDKEKAAEAFYKLLNQDVDNRNEEEANKKVNEYLKYYSDDPAFIAQLKLKMISKYHSK